MFNWERDDDPWEVHALWSQKCMHVIQKKGEAYIEQVLEEASQKNQQSEKNLCEPAGLSTGTSDDIMYPDYKQQASREDTFINWKYKNIQKPADLAKAGFFYRG